MPLKPAVCRPMPAIAVLLVVFSLFFVSACGTMSENRTNDREKTFTETPSAGRTENSQDNQTSRPAPSAAIGEATGLCVNKYYPLLTKERRNYKISGSGSESYSLIQKDLTDQGFKEERKFSSDMAITTNWICTDEGIRNAEFSNNAVFQKGAAEMTTVESSGVTIPKDITLGKEFSSDYTVKVKVAVGPVKADADGKVNIKSKVEALDETVTVAGKSYSAARVKSTINIVITMKGKQMPGAKIDLTNWFSPEIGLIKQENKGTLGTNTVEFTGKEE